jgi:hypothetical protein
MTEIIAFHESSLQCIPQLVPQPNGVRFSRCGPATPKMRAARNASSASSRFGRHADRRRGQGPRAAPRLTYKFSGKKKDRLTILRGSLQSDKPKGSRICSLAFLIDARTPPPAFPSQFDGFDIFPTLVCFNGLITAMSVDDGSSSR